MATIQTINVGAADNDSTGDPIRQGGQKVNTSLTNLNTELVALLAAVGAVSGTSNLGVYGGTGTILSDNGSVKGALEELEGALDTLQVLSAGYVPAALPASPPAAGDSIETAVAKLDRLARDVEEADRFAGTFDASIGTLPATANGGILSGEAVRQGMWFTTTTAGTIAGINFKTGDRLIAIADNPSTAVIGGNWHVEYNQPEAVYDPTSAGQNVAFGGRYLQGDHAINLPAITPQQVGNAIEIAGVAPWGSAGMASAAWTPNGADTIEAVTLPANSLDIVTLIPSAANVWLVRIGGAPVPELAASYDTFAQLVAVNPNTVAAGTQAQVTNDPDPELIGVYVASGATGGNGTGWVK